MKEFLLTLTKGILLVFLEVYHLVVLEVTSPKYLGDMLFHILSKTNDFLYQQLS